MKLFASLLSLVALSSVIGCAANADDGVDQEASEVVALSVTPGKFRLFKEPNHVTDPECESFTDLELSASGKANLVNGLGGKCSLVALIDPNPRDFSLVKLTRNACGAKVYEGSRRVALGPAVTGLATIKITDNRSGHCEADAKVVVEESGQPKMFSKDTPTEREAIVCRELVDHGAVVHFFANDKGTIVRAKYTETDFVQTTLVSDMTVCTPLPTPHHDTTTATGCNDVSEHDSYSAVLTQGGFTGIPTVQVFKSQGNAGEKTLVHSLGCKFVP